jgi:hypothetical protein
LRFEQDDDLVGRVGAAQQVLLGKSGVIALWRMGVVAFLPAREILDLVPDEHETVHD